MKALPGRGLTGRADGRAYVLGSSRLIVEQGIDRIPMLARARQLESEGRSLSWLAEVAPETRLVGLLAFGDKPKPTAAAAIAALDAKGIEAIIISGDNSGSVHAIARKLGIDRAISNVLPAGKADVITLLRSEARTVAMVGDGVNDAPALAAADVGIAMSTGTDVAMHAAGITLMRGDPRLVNDAIDISRRTYSKIRQGLFWAFIYNVVGIPLAALGLLSPVIAGAAMAFSSVSVVANALTLRRWRPSAT
jgi:Cu+-exporting ATPase